MLHTYLTGLPKGEIRLPGTTFFFLSGNWQHGLFVAPAAGSAGTDTPNGAEQVIFNGAVQVSMTEKGHC